MRTKGENTIPDVVNGFYFYRTAIQKHWLNQNRHALFQNPAKPIFHGPYDPAKDRYLLQPDVKKKLQARITALAKSYATPKSNLPPKNAIPLLTLTGTVYLSRIQYATLQKQIQLYQPSKCQCCQQTSTLVPLLLSFNSPETLQLHALRFYCDSCSRAMLSSIPELAPSLPLKQKTKIIGELPLWNAWKNMTSR